MRVSLATKIFLAFSLVIALFGGVLAFSIYKMAHLEEGISTIRKGVMPLAVELRDMDRELKGLEDALGRKKLNDLQWLAEYLPYLDPIHDLDELADKVALTQAIHGTTEDTEAFFQEVEATFESITDGVSLGKVLKKDLHTGDLPLAVTTNRAIYKYLAQAFIEAVGANETSKARHVQALLRASIRHFRKALDQLYRQTSKTMTEFSSRAQEHEEQAILYTIISSLIALITSLVMLVVTLLAVRPIRRLTEGVQRIGKGDFTGPVGVATRDEIGMLAREFDTMIEHLARRDEELALQGEKLMKSERLAVIGKMSSFVAHEIRNPLSAINLNVEMLQEDLEDHEEAGDLLDAIAREVDRLVAVTEQYLRLARLPKPTPTTMDPARLVTSLMRFLGKEIGAQGIVLETRVDDVGPMVADENQLHQALLNVVRNSMDVLDEGGHITVSLEGDDEEVRITVADDGPGIPVELQERVFEPFYSSKAMGTGLGLPLSLEIVELHGGRIAIDSSEGQGTTTTIHLPRGAPGAEVHDEGDDI